MEGSIAGVPSPVSSNQATTAQNIPAKIGPYKVVAEVGVGGLGRVFRGIDERNGNSVAIKVLHDKYARNSKFLGIFHRELLIVSSLHHKHIVSYLDSFFNPPDCYIVTEFVDGWSGYSFLKQVKRVPPLVGLCVVIDMLQGIDHLHLHDTIHSDLSAANYLIDKKGRILVTDFGLACRLEVEDYRNYMIGTPGYYSPEHISNEPIVQQTDIYCAGLILFELVTGRKIIPASNDRHQTLELMRRLKIPALGLTDPAMEKALNKLLKTALAFSVSRRYQSADLMMFACYEILKRYEIRFARHAIKKFLVDQALVPGPYEGHDQAIYHGSP
ncbi:serine/threonine protein kinase [bacterium]|nr:serine/threonine protein kinase [bacterium]